MTPQEANNLSVKVSRLTVGANYRSASDEELEDGITILELPPVTDAQSAVKVGVSYQIKKGRKR